MSRHPRVALSMMSALAIHVRPNQIDQPYSQQVSGKQSDLQLQKLSEPRKPVISVLDICQISVLEIDFLRLLPDVMVCLGACV